MNFLGRNRIIIAIIGIFILNLFFILPVSADKYGLDESASKVAAFEGQEESYTDNFINTKIGTFIGIVLSFVGVAFLVLMIYAGISWMTAAGSQEKVTKAKDLIINAIIGLVIVLGAYAITSFIGDRLL